MIDVPSTVEAAACRHCGMRIKRRPSGSWLHVFTNETRCSLEAKPVSAWGGA